MSQLRAILLAAIFLGLFILATPGIDSLDLSKEARQKALNEGSSESLLNVLVAVRKARRPALKLLTPLQRPLRIEQSWGLYGAGPARVRRMEVWLDDVLAYRSEDDDHDWREAMFRNRRLRPMIDTVSRKPNAQNRDALMWLIADRAASDHPGLSRIEVRFTVARFPDKTARIAHAFAMVSPSWAAERL